MLQINHVLYIHDLLHTYMHIYVYNIKSEVRVSRTIKDTGDEM